MMGKRELRYKARSEDDGMIVTCLLLREGAFLKEIERCDFLTWKESINVEIRS